MINIYDSEICDECTDEMRDRIQKRKQDRALMMAEHDPQCWEDWMDEEEEYDDADIIPDFVKIMQSIANDSKL